MAQVSRQEGGRLSALEGEEMKVDSSQRMKMDQLLMAEEGMWWKSQRGKETDEQGFLISNVMDLPPN